MSKFDKLVEAMLAGVGGTFGQTSDTGGSIGNQDTYAPGDARIPHSIYGGVVTRNGLRKNKKKKRKKSNG
jgi:hypothetical protein